MKKKVHQTKNLQKIQKICKLTQQYCWLTLLQGESGYGKTFGLKYFALTRGDVYVVDGNSTDNKNPIGLWKRLAIQVLGEDFFSRNCPDATLAEVMEYLVAGLNSKSEPSLVILDEGGFLSLPNLKHMRSLVDRTKSTTGFILSGPEYFIDKVNKMIEESKKENKGGKKKINEGVNEVQTRIDIIVTLLAPNYREKCKICASEEIDEKKAIEIAKKSAEFRSLFRNINLSKVGINSRYEHEWVVGAEV